MALLWFVTFIFRVKTQRQKLFMWTLGACIFYFATYSVYVYPQADYYTMVRLDCACAPLIVCIQALAVLYLDMHRTKVRKLPNWKFLLLFPALVYAAVYGLIYYLLGFDNAAYITKYYDENGALPTNLNADLVNMYNLFGEVLLDAYCFIMSAVLLWECVIISRNDGYKFGDVYRFFFKGASTTQSRAISILYITIILLLMPMIIFGRAYMMNNPIIGASLTVLIAIAFHFLCHVEFFGENIIVTLHELSHVQSSESIANIVTGTPESTKDEPKENVPEAVSTTVTDTTNEPTITESNENGSVDDTIAEQNTIPASKEESIENNSMQEYNLKYENLAKRFDKLMVEEHLYREENLTLAFLSERLGVGRTMISTMINTIYGTSFRDLVSKYRIDAAKKYMLAHPNATQEAVAFECGFKDASSLNHKFKDSEGLTPLMWLTQQVKA